MIVKDTNFLYIFQQIELEHIVLELVKEFKLSRDENSSIHSLLLIFLQLFRQGDLSIKLGILFRMGERMSFFF